MTTEWLESDRSRKSVLSPAAQPNSGMTARAGRARTFDPKLPMSPTPTSHASDLEPGQLLKELEQRQDEVLEQLDALDNQLQEVLRGLGVTLDDEIDQELV